MYIGWIRIGLREALIQITHAECIRIENKWKRIENRNENPAHIMKNFVFCLARQVSNACINCCLRLHLMWCRGRFAQVDTITTTASTTTATETAKANRSSSSNTSEKKMYVIAVQTKAMFAFTFEGGFGLFPKWFCCCWSIPIAGIFG